MHMAKDPNQEGIVVNWKEIATKVGTNAANLFYPVMPTTVGTMVNTTQVIRDVRKAKRSQRVTSRVMSNQYDLEGRRAGKGFEQALQDIQNGTYAFDKANREMYDDYETETADDFVMPTGDKAADMTNEEIVLGGLKGVSKAMIQANSAQLRGLQSLSTALIQSNVKTSRAMTATLTASLMSGISTINTSLTIQNQKLNDISNNIRNQLAFDNQNTIQFYSSAITMMNGFGGMLSNLQNSLNPQERKRGRRFDIKGGFSLRGLKDYILDGIRESQLGTLFTGGDYSDEAVNPGIRNLIRNGGRAFGAGGGIKGFLLSKLIPKSINDTLGAFDKSFQNILEAGMSRLYDITSSNGILSALGIPNIIGNKREGMYDLHMGRFSKDAMPWNGSAQRFLTEVIPEYLASIDSGVNKTDKRYYDSQLGTFQTKTSIEKRFMDEYADTINLSMRESFTELADTLKRSGKTDDEIETITQQFERLLDQRFIDSKTDTSGAKAQQNLYKMSEVLAKAGIEETEGKSVLRSIESGFRDAVGSINDLLDRIQSSDQNIYRSINNQQGAQTVNAAFERFSSAHAVTTKDESGSEVQSMIRNRYGARGFSNVPDVAKLIERIEKERHLLKKADGTPIPHAKSLANDFDLQNTVLSLIFTHAGEEDLVAAVSAAHIDDRRGHDTEDKLRDLYGFRGFFNKATGYVSPDQRQEGEKITITTRFGDLINGTGERLGNAAGAFNRTTERITQAADRASEHIRRGGNKLSSGAHDLVYGSTAWGRQIPPTDSNPPSSDDEPVGHGYGPIGFGPAEIGRFAARNGYISGGGANAGLFTEGAARLGMRATPLGNTYQLKSSLSKGHPVILGGKSTGYGSPFTRAGHVIAADKVVGNKARVLDPLSGKKTYYDINRLGMGTTHAWSYSVGYGIGKAASSFFSRKRKRANTDDESKKVDKLQQLATQTADSALGRSESEVQKDETIVTSVLEDMRKEEPADDVAGSIIQSNNMVRAAMSTIVGAFQNFGARIFGKEGILRKIWDSDARKKITGRLFTDEDAIFGDQYRWVKENFGKVKDETLGYIGKGYDYLYDNTMQYLYGMDADGNPIHYTQSDKWQNNRFTSQFLNRRYQKDQKELRKEEREAEEKGIEFKKNPIRDYVLAEEDEEDPDRIIRSTYNMENGQWSSYTASQWKEEIERRKKLAEDAEKVKSVNEPSEETPPEVQSSVHIPESSKEEKPKEEKSDSIIPSALVEKAGEIKDSAARGIADAKAKIADAASEAGVQINALSSAIVESSDTARAVHDKMVEARDTVSAAVKDEADRASTALKDTVAVIQEGAKKLKSGIDAHVEAFTGNATEDQKQKAANIRKDFFTKMREGLPKALAMGAGGAALGMLNGQFSLLGSMFLPGGPIGGAVVGAGLSILSNTEAFKTLMFGRTTEDGTREGGLISQKLREGYKKAAPFIIGGATLGALKGALQSALGFHGGLGVLGMQILPGGILGGALLGAGLGFLKNSEKFKTLLFGEKDDDGKRSGKFLSDTWNKVQSGFKSFLPRAGKAASGAAIGGLSAAVLHNMGFMGAMMTPFGPLGGAALGLGLGIAASTSKFNEWMFGTRMLDENGNPTDKRYKDGFLSRVQNILMANVVEPISMSFKDHMIDLVDWTKDRITDPFRLAFGPIIDSFRNIKDDVVDFVHDTFEKLGSGIMDIMKSSIKAVFSPITRAIGFAGRNIAGIASSGIKLALLPISASLTGLSLLTNGKRRKEYFDFYSKYYKEGNIMGNLKQSWKIAEDNGKGKGIGEKLKDILDAYTGNGEIADSFREGYNEQMTEEGKNTFNWRNVSRERRERAKARRERRQDKKKWDKIDHLRRSIINKDLVGRDTELTEGQVKKYQKRFTALGIDKEKLTTSSDIMDLLYRRDKFKESLNPNAKAEEGTPTDIVITETPEQKAARESTEKYQSEMQELMNNIKESAGTIAYDIVESRKEQHEEAVYHRATQRLKRRAKKAGVKIDVRDPDLRDWDIDSLTADKLTDYKLNRERYTDIFDFMYSQNIDRMSGADDRVSRIERSRNPLADVPDVAGQAPTSPEDIVIDPNAMETPTDVEGSKLTRNTTLFERMTGQSDRKYYAWVKNKKSGKTFPMIVHGYTLADPNFDAIFEEKCPDLEIMSDFKVYKNKKTPYDDIDKTNNKKKRAQRRKKRNKKYGSNLFHFGLDSTTYEAFFNEDGSVKTDIVPDEPEEDESSDETVGHGIGYGAPTFIHTPIGYGPTPPITSSHNPSDGDDRRPDVSLVFRDFDVNFRDSMKKAFESMGLSATGEQLGAILTTLQESTKQLGAIESHTSESVGIESAQLEADTHGQINRETVAKKGKRVFGKQMMSKFDSFTSWLGIRKKEKYDEVELKESEAARSGTESAQEAEIKQATDTSKSKEESKEKRSPLSMIGTFFKTAFGGNPVLKFIATGAKKLGTIGLLGGLGFTIAELIRPGTAKSIGSKIDAVSNYIDSGEGSLGDVWNKIQTFVRGKLGDAANFYENKVYPWVIDHTGIVGQWWDKNVHPMLTNIGDGLGGFWDSIKDIPGKIFHSIGNIAHSLGVFIDKHVDDVTDAVATVTKELAVPLGKLALSVFKGVFRGIWSIIGPKLGFDKTTDDLSDTDVMVNDMLNVNTREELIGSARTEEQAKEIASKQGFENAKIFYNEKSGQWEAINRQTLGSRTVVTEEGDTITVANDMPETLVRTGAKLMNNTLRPGTIQGAKAGFTIAGKGLKALGAGGKAILGVTSKIPGLGLVSKTGQAAISATEAAAKTGATAVEGGKGLISKLTGALSKATGKAVQDNSDDIALKITGSAVEAAGKAVGKQVSDTGAFKVISAAVEKLVQFTSKLATDGPLAKACAALGSKGSNNVIMKIISWLVDKLNLILKVPAKMINKVVSILQAGLTKLGLKTTAEAATAGISMLVMGTIGGIMGAIDAPHLFGVNAEDVTPAMRTVSAIMQALLSGTAMIGTMFDILFTIAPLVPVIGTNLKQNLAEIIYGIICKNDEDAIKDMKASQEKVAAEAKLYNAMNNTNLTTDAFNDLHNKTVFNKGIDAGKNLINKIAGKELFKTAADTSASSDMMQKLMDQGYTSEQISIMSNEQLKSLMGSIGYGPESVRTKIMSSKSYRGYSQINNSLLGSLKSTTSFNQYAPIKDTTQQIDVNVQRTLETDPDVVVLKSVDEKLGKFTSSFEKYLNGNLKKKDTETSKIADVALATLKTVGTITAATLVPVAGSTKLINALGKTVSDLPKSMQNTGKSILSSVKSMLKENAALGYGNADMYKQGNSNWANMPIGTFPNGQTATMKDAGCGPTALAAVANNLLGYGDVSFKRVSLGYGPITPAQMGMYAAQNGFITSGGANEGLFTAGAASMGLSGTALSDGNQVKASLLAGRPVVLTGQSSSSSDPYTSAGHIVVADGISGNRASVLDPNTGRHKLYDLASVARKTQHAWSYSRSVGYGRGDKKQYKPVGYGILSWVADKIKTAFSPTTAAAKNAAQREQITSGALSQTAVARSLTSGSTPAVAQRTVTAEKTNAATQNAAYQLTHGTPGTTTKVTTIPTTTTVTPVASSSQTSTTNNTVAMLQAAQYDGIAVNGLHPGNSGIDTSAMDANYQYYKTKTNDFTITNSDVQKLVDLSIKRVGRNRNYVTRSGLHWVLNTQYFGLNGGTYGTITVQPMLNSRGNYKSVSMTKNQMAQICAAAIYSQNLQLPKGQTVSTPLSAAEKVAIICNAIRVMYGFTNAVKYFCEGSSKFNSYVNLATNAEITNELNKLTGASQSSSQTSVGGGITLTDVESAAAEMIANSDNPEETAEQIASNIEAADTPQQRGIMNREQLLAYSQLSSTGLFSKLKLIGYMGQASLNSILNGTSFWEELEALTRDEMEGTQSSNSSSSTTDDSNTETSISIADTVKTEGISGASPYLSKMLSDPKNIQEEILGQTAKLIYRRESDGKYSMVTTEDDGYVSIGPYQAYSGKDNPNARTLMKNLQNSTGISADLRNLFGKYRTKFEKNQKLTAAEKKELSSALDNSQWADQIRSTVDKTGLELFNNSYLGGKLGLSHWYDDNRLKDPRTMAMLADIGNTGFGYITNTTGSIGKHSFRTHWSPTTKEKELEAAYNILTGGKVYWSNTDATKYTKSYTNAIKNAYNDLSKHSMKFATPPEKKKMSEMFDPGTNPLGFGQGMDKSIIRTDESPSDIRHNLQKAGEERIRLQKKIAQQSQSTTVKIPKGLPNELSKSSKIDIMIRAKDVDAGSLQSNDLQEIYRPKTTLKMEKSPVGYGGIGLTRVKRIPTVYNDSVGYGPDDGIGKTISTGFISDTINGMKVNVKQCNSSNYTACNSRYISYVVMHYTGNSSDTAAGNANYFTGGNRNASAHLFVDNSNIYQSVKLHDRAWHCGTKGTYYHSNCRNNNSIGIEMCCSGNYKVSDKTKENAAQLCAYLCRMIGIKGSDVEAHVVRHWDVTHKQCPAQMAGSGNSEWAAFKARVKAILGGASETPATKVEEIPKKSTTISSLNTDGMTRIQTLHAGLGKISEFLMTHLVGATGIDAASLGIPDVLSGKDMEAATTATQQTASTETKTEETAKPAEEAKTSEAASGSFTIKNHILESITGTDRDRYLAAAQSQVGYKEKTSTKDLKTFSANAGSGNYTKYAKEMLGYNPAQWCAAFVEWNGRAAGIPSDIIWQSPDAASTKNVLKHAKDNGTIRYRGEYTPEPGDQILFNGNGVKNPKSATTGTHTAIVEGVEGSNVNTIEGNTSDVVKRRSRALTNNTIIGYVHPKWTMKKETVDPRTLLKLGYGKPLGFGPAFPKYALSESQIKGMANIVQHEQPQLSGMEAEASLIANRTDIKGDEKATVANIVKTVTGGWFADGKNRFNKPGNPSSTAIKAVKNVIVGGRRTLPRYVDEHDCFSDISTVTNNGKKINKKTRSAYKPHVSIVKNRMGSTYTFHSYPNNAADPFGYTSSKMRSKWGDEHYNSDGTTVSVEEPKTEATTTATPAQDTSITANTGSIQLASITPATDDVNIYNADGSIRTDLTFGEKMAAMSSAIGKIFSAITGMGSDNGTTIAESNSIEATVPSKQETPAEKTEEPTITPEITPADDIETTIWKSLRNAGYTQAGTAGMMGNLYAESGLKPTNLQNTFEKKLGYTDDSYTKAIDNGSYKKFVNDSAGYGLAQWTYKTRKQGLLNFAKDQGKSIGDAGMQTQYLIKELKGYKGVDSALRSASDVTAASTKVLTGFEKPANQGASVQAKRASYSQKYYDKFTALGYGKPRFEKIDRPIETVHLETPMEQEQRRVLTDKDVPPFAVSPKDFQQYGFGPGMKVDTGLDFSSTDGRIDSIIGILSQWHDESAKAAKSSSTNNAGGGNTINNLVTNNTVVATPDVKNNPNVKATSFKETMARQHWILAGRQNARRT